MSKFKLELFTEEFRAEVASRVKACIKQVERERFSYIYLCYYEDTGECDVLGYTRCGQVKDCIYTFIHNYEFIINKEKGIDYVIDSLIRTFKDQLINNRVLPLNNNIIQFLKELQQLSEKYEVIVTAEDEGIALATIPRESIKMAKGYCFSIYNEMPYALSWVEGNGDYVGKPRNELCVKDYINESGGFRKELLTEEFKEDIRRQVEELIADDKPGKYKDLYLYFDVVTGKFVLSPNNIDNQFEHCVRMASVTDYGGVWKGKQGRVEIVTNLLVNMVKEIKLNDE